MPQRRDDPYLNFNFRVEIDGIAIAGFSEAKLPGDPELFEWWNDVVQGNVTRRNLVIVLLDEQRNEVARWGIRRAWPSKWVGPDLRGLGNEVAIETLELSHEGIEIA
jgi:phage tail-like protein